MPPSVRILVIDDELDDASSKVEGTRRDVYTQLSRDFDVRLIEGPDEVDSTLVDFRPNFILLDMVLNNWGISVHFMLNRIPADIPVALISRRWGTEINTLKEIMNSHDNIVNIFTYEDLVEPARRGGLVVLIDSHVKKSNAITSSPSVFGDHARDHDKSLIIAHFSDFQFGSESPQNFSIERFSYPQIFRQIAGRLPDICVISGDVAERGRVSDYRLALEVLPPTLERLLGSNWRSKVFLVPGNHDVNQALYLSAHFDSRSRTLDLSQATDYSGQEPYAFFPFQEFCWRLTGDARWMTSARNWWVEDLSGPLGSIFVGINTSEVLDPHGFPVRELSQQTTTAALQAVSDKFTGSAVCFCVIHHPLLDQADGLISNSPIFLGAKGVIKNIVVLSGHRHAESMVTVKKNGVEAHEISAASATKAEENRPRDSLRGFSIIVAKRRKGIIREIQNIPVYFHGEKYTPGPAETIEFPVVD